MIPEINGDMGRYIMSCHMCREQIFARSISESDVRSCTGVVIETHFFGEK